MSFNVNTPERQAKIAQFLRMLEKSTPEWKEEYLKQFEDHRRKKKKDTRSKANKERVFSER